MRTIITIIHHNEANASLVDLEEIEAYVVSAEILPNMKRETTVFHYSRHINGLSQAGALESATQKLISYT